MPISLHHCPYVIFQSHHTSLDRLSSVSKIPEFVFSGKQLAILAIINSQ